MKGSKTILSVLLLLYVALSATAADGVYRRGCRPQLTKKGLPACQRAPRRADASQRLLGDCRQLVVLVAFGDQAFKDDEAATMALWQRIFNEEHFTESPFYGSVYDYFYAQSYGEFRLTFDVHYIQLSENRFKYRSTDDDDENSKYLVLDVVDTLEARGIDWSPYDWNGDGYVNQLLIVYAGKGMNDGGDSNSIWPHQWWLSLHENCEPRKVGGEGQELLVDCYCCVNELTGKNTYGTFGTICHEYSHCFGLPDFYYGSTQYVGNWDLMDYGNYGKDGFCPPGYSAHERWLMGWLEVTELTEQTTIANMSPLCDAAEAYLIRNDGFDHEYYIVENRQPSSWDQSLPGSGLVVFHIDYDEQVWWTDFPNERNHKRYTIIPANNRTSVYSSSNWGYPYKENNLLTNESQPAATLIHANADGTLLMSKPITNMAVTDGLASFDFMAEPSAIHLTQAQSPSEAGQVLYRVGPIYIIRCTDGKVIKVKR